MEEFDQAMATLALAAGDDLAEFIGGGPLRVNQTQVFEAGKMLASLYAEHPDPPRRTIEMAIREAKAQTFEAVWNEQISPELKDPAKRAAMIAFIESHTGRPLPLTPDAFGNEQD